MNIDQGDMKTYPITSVKTRHGEMPSPGFGTFELKGADCREAVEFALDIGYRHIDTAEMYGNEEEVGKALKASSVDREDVFLTTKIWMENLNAGSLPAVFGESLRKLNTEYADLLLIHWPNPKVPLDETLRKLNEFVEAGYAGQIGISNFPTKLMDDALALSKAPIFCNQVEYHPFLSQEAVLDKCRANDMILTAYSPLAQGKVLDHDVLKEIGESHGKTSSQVCLRWLTQQENVVPIPRSSSREHIETNLDIFDFTLTEEEMKRIHALACGDRIIDPEFAPDWD